MTVEEVFFVGLCAGMCLCKRLKVVTYLVIGVSVANYVGYLVNEPNEPVEFLLSEPVE